MHLASLFREKFSHVVNRPSSTADFVKRSRHSPHHPSQEGGSDDVNANRVADEFYFDRAHRADSVFNVGLEFLGEGTVVVLSHEKLCRLLHFGQIQWLCAFVRVASLERIVSPQENRVSICAISRAKATVKLRRNSLGFYDTNVWRQHAIKGARHGVKRDRRLEVKVANLRPSMCAAIGAAGSVDLDIFARDLANSFCQCALNGSPSSLCGPAAKVGSVV